MCPASPRFLGIWDGVVFDYEVFDETLLERDLERIQSPEHAAYWLKKVVVQRSIDEGRRRKRSSALQRLTASLGKRT